MASNLRTFVVENIFTFEVAKVLQVKSRKIGIVLRLIQFLTLVYIAVYTMYFEKGYQLQEQGFGGVVSKVKGISYNQPEFVKPTMNDKVWDAATYVIPPKQNAAFFIATEIITTAKQKLGFCEEDIPCNSDSDCVTGKILMMQTGVLSGNCIETVHPTNATKKPKFCEVFAWCPIQGERAAINKNIIGGNAKNFTVFLKNYVQFSRWHVKKSNILDWMTTKFIKSCRYNPDHPKNKFCPIFRIQDIVEWASEGQQRPNDTIWMHGGLISIDISWDCNLDFSLNKCVPEYNFHRLDDVYADAEGTQNMISQGFNFRYAEKYFINDIEHRTLMKVYGIQFLITLSASARKFNLYTFSMNVGSAVGLMGGALIFSEFAAMLLIDKYKLFRNTEVDLDNKTIEDEFHSSNKRVSQQGETDKDVEECKSLNT